MMHVTSPGWTFAAQGPHLPGVTWDAIAGHPGCLEWVFLGQVWPGSLQAPYSRRGPLRVCRGPGPSPELGGRCDPADIEEKGVRMKLTVIDTPGFGDHINNENW